MSDANWTRLDASAVQQLYVAFTSDGIAPACLRAIESRLLASGILFTSKDFSKTTDQAFQMHINHFFTKFVRDALLQLTICAAFTFSFVCVTLLFFPSTHAARICRVVCSAWRRPAPPPSPPPP